MEVKKRFSKKSLEDFKLIDEAVNNGNQHAYADLMDRYKRSVYHMILKMIKNTDDTEDLTIVAFTKAFKNLAKFKKDYAFSTWLFRIATNNTIDFIRKKKLNTYSLSSAFSTEKGESIIYEVEDEKLNPQDESIENQKIELVRMFVSKLPVKYQRLVRLRYFEEYTYEEIAKALDRPLGTVKAQLHKSRELMYELVKHNKSHI